MAFQKGLIKTKNKKTTVILWFAWAGVVLHFNREPQAVTNLLKWQFKKKKKKDFILPF